MQIKIFCPMWGSAHLTLKQFMQNVKESGFAGVEMNIPFDKDYSEELIYLLKEFDLLLIAQQWLPPLDETVNEYIERMGNYLLHLASFKPLFINSHTGKDIYSFEENCKIFEAAERIIAETGVEIVHETHRGRALFSTWSAKQFFEKFPQLRITADFSHWCCVSESLLEDQKDFMAKAMQRAGYIHARVGHAQGPQVHHPGAKENEKELNAHLAWWKQILENAKNAGRKEMAICTEFGPEPYMQKLPFSNKPVADQWEINLFMKGIIEEKLLP